MFGFIDDYNFGEMNAMKYFAPPASWSNEKKRDNIKMKIFSDEFYGAEKKDGFFTKVVKDEDGNVIVYSRSRNVNGEYVNKVEWVPHLNPFFEKIPNGTCLLGELYFPSNPGSKNVQTILGCLKEKARARQESGEKLHFYVFDCLAFEGKSLIKTHAIDRFKMLDDLKLRLRADYVSFAHYVHGRELWDMTYEILNNGGEGVVITHQNAYYEPDKRPSKTTLKIKQELKQTIDCVIIGANKPTKEYSGKQLDSWTYWVNAITDERLEMKPHFSEYRDGAAIVPVTKNYYFKWPGSLQLGLHNGTELEYYGDISGLSEEILTNWAKYVGRVCEIGGMMIDDESKRIRHPKFIQWRTDKVQEECSIHQLW